MKDLFKVFAKDIYNEKFDAAESVVYLGVAFFGMFILMLLSGLLAYLTE